MIKRSIKELQNSRENEGSVCARLKKNTLVLHFVRFFTRTYADITNTINSCDPPDVALLRPWKAFVEGNAREATFVLICYYWIRVNFLENSFLEITMENKLDYRIPRDIAARRPYNLPPNYSVSGQATFVCMTGFSWSSSNRRYLRQPEVGPF